MTDNEKLELAVQKVEKCIQEQTAATELLIILTILSSPTPSRLAQEFERRLADMASEGHFNPVAVLYLQRIHRLIASWDS